MATTYGATPDPGGRMVATTFMVLMLLATIAYLVVTGAPLSSPSLLEWGVLVLAVGLGDIALIPRRYTLDSKGVTIDKKWWKTSVPTDIITRVELLDKNKMPVRIPLPPLGWIGFSGSYGKFIVRQPRTINTNAGKKDKRKTARKTNRLQVWTFNSNKNERFVLIHTLRGVIVISPEPATRFMNQAQEVLRNRRLGRIR
jgi:hypothetical protein